MKRRNLLLGAALFAVVEALAILYAVWPALMRKEPARHTEIRLGVSAIPPLDRDIEDAWTNFASDFSRKYGCALKPYFASSSEELASGLINGSLDLVYMDAANFLELNGRAKLKLWFYHRLAKRELDRLRAVLVCVKDIPHISESKGLRLSFSGRNSMTGHIVPGRFLDEKLPAKAKDWFSSITTAPDEDAAFAALLSGRADVVAACAISLDSLDERLSKEQIERMKTLWISMPLPENVLCSPESLSPQAKDVLASASAQITSTKLREEFLSARSMVFLPPDYSFLELKNKLQSFLEGPKAARSKTPVSKE